MRTVGLISVVLSITPHCLALSPLVCHSNFLKEKVEKNVHCIRGSVASVMCDSSWKLRRVQLFPLNTKTAVSQAGCGTPSWRKQPELSATSLTPRFHPLKPATTFPNYPTGIENSTCLYLLETMDVKYCIQNWTYWRLLTQNRWEFELSGVTEPQTTFHLWSTPR